MYFLKQTRNYLNWTNVLEKYLGLLVLRTIRYKTTNFLASSTNILIVLTNLCRIFVSFTITFKNTTAQGDGRSQNQFSGITWLRLVLSRSNLYRNPFQDISYRLSPTSKFRFSQDFPTFLSNVLGVLGCL